MRKMKKYVLPGILSALIISASLAAAESSALNKSQSANGQGRLVNEDGSRSQFTFNVHRNPNGKVTGQAKLRNPSLKPGNGQSEQIIIDVSCLKITGNIAVIGGMTKRKNNQTETEAIYFAVQDNGAAGGKIFRGFYFDDDASTKGDAQLCQTIEPEVLVLEPIAEGNIRVNH